MDTSEWTGIKGVTFDFDVIYDDKAYPAGTYINLYNRWNNTGYLHGKKGDDYYDFYVPLCNTERQSASCDFVTIATNNYSDVWSENYDVLNYARYDPDKSAKHDALKTAQTQIIGRIGGLTLEDTGDWRFSNLFKQAKKPTDWLVNGTVKKVDSSKAKHLLADFIDIRGNNVEHNGKVSIREHIMDALGLNTYGAEPYKNNTTYKLIDLPLTPGKNNVKALRKQALRVGYKSFMDLETIGCYYGLNQGEGQFIQVTPVYYYFDSQSGQLFPVDIYMKNNNEYVPINLYNNDRNDNVTPYRITVNWQEEDTRRNVTNEENKESQDLIKALTSTDRTWVAASGTRANIGTAQRLYLDESVRTFVGSPFTNGLNNNPDYVLASKEAVNGNVSTYHYHGQKWHFTLGLPSSAVWVKHGEECTEDNIKKYRKKKSYLVCALDILAVGSVWTLRYKNTNLSQITIVDGQKPLDPKKITVPDPDPSKPDIPIPVVEIYDTMHSNRDDIDTVGTH